MFADTNSSSKPCTGKLTLISTLVHAPEILLRQLSVGTVLLFRNMLGKQINLLADLTHCLFQFGEVSRRNNRFFHTFTSFRSGQGAAASPCCPIVLCQVTRDGERLRGISWVRHSNSGKGVHWD